MPCDRCLFRVGDKVHVLYATTVISFQITHVNVEGMQAIYRGVTDAGVQVTWWPEDRLDYDLSREQKAAAAELERSMHEVEGAIKHARFCLAVAEKLLPGWYIEKIKQADLHNNDIL